MALPYATTSQVEKISKEVATELEKKLDEKIEQSATTVEDGVLKVGKIEGPQPVITIDGVDYYHKCEFNLETPLNTETRFNLLTGEEITSTSELAIKSTFSGYRYQGSKIGKCLGLFYTTAAGAYTLTIGLYNWYSPITYTSRAFTVVQTMSEVTDNTKICLPECSAYYGFLSDDGKTFISYFNLIAEPVTKISDGVNQVDIQDSRLKTTIEDAGKIVSVNAGGHLVLINAPEQGTKLYRHAVSFSGGPITNVHFLSTTNEKITFGQTDGVYGLSFPTRYGTPYPFWSFSEYLIVSLPYGKKNLAKIDENGEISLFTFTESTSIVDTVTEL